MVDKNQLDAFIEENMKLLYAFMLRYQLDDDFYGPLAIRFLRVAERYLLDEKLRRYRFSTIVWMNLRSEMFEQFRKDQDELLAPISLRLNEFAYIQDSFSADELCSILEKTLTAKQREALCLRCKGYSNAEIAVQERITIKAVEARFARIRKKVSALLKELQ